MADSAQQFDLVDFESLTWSTSIPETTSAKLGLDVLCRHLKAGGKAFHDRDERLAVALACGEVTKHVFRLSLTPS